MMTLICVTILRHGDTVCQCFFHKKLCKSSNNMCMIKWRHHNRELHHKTSAIYLPVSSGCVGAEIKHKVNFIGILFPAKRNISWKNPIIRRSNHNESWRKWNAESKPMGFFPDTSNFGLRMRRECRERFPRYRLQRKPLVSDPGMHHRTCVTHVPWCMSGSQARGGGGNVPGIPGACATRNFTYLARGSLNQTKAQVLEETSWDSRVSYRYNTVQHNVILHVV